MATTGKAFISCSHRFVDNSFVFIINSRRAYNIGPLCDTKNSCEKFCSLVARYNQLPSPSDVQELVKLYVKCMNDKSYPGCRLLQINGLGDLKSKVSLHFSWSRDRTCSN